MGVKEKRVKCNNEFRRVILDSARELYINEGYEKFMMRKLAKKIGYSSTTIYVYFKGKDDLPFAICEQGAEQYFVNLNHIRRLNINPLDVLRQALLYCLEFGFTDPNQYEIFLFTSRDVYGIQEFMKKESMARNSFLLCS